MKIIKFIICLFFFVLISCSPKNDNETYNVNAFDVIFRYLSNENVNTNIENIVLYKERFEKPSIIKFFAIFTRVSKPADNSNMIGNFDSIKQIRLLQLILLKYEIRNINKYPYYPDNYDDFQDIGFIAFSVKDSKKIIKARIKINGLFLELLIGDPTAPVTSFLWKYYDKDGIIRNVLKIDEMQK